MSEIVYMIIRKFCSKLVRVAGNFRDLAPEPLAEIFVGSNICGSMPGNHTHQ